MDEVFGPSSLVSQIAIAKTANATSELLPNVADHILFAKNIEAEKHPEIFKKRRGQTVGRGRSTNCDSG